MVLHFLSTPDPVVVLCDTCLRMKTRLAQALPPHQVCVKLPDKTRRRYLNHQKARSSAKSTQPSPDHLSNLLSQLLHHDCGSLFLLLIRNFRTEN